MEVVIIASGSSGNAALVRSGETALLIDAGLSLLQMRRRLEEFGCSLDEVTAVLVTHEHADHVHGLGVLLRRYGLAVWATAGTWSELEVRSTAGGELASGRSLDIGRLRIMPVATSHDAREPVALVVDDGRHRLGWCTDTGLFTGLLAERLADCHLLCVEANHDADMLRHGPYPWPLKQRIASRLGHLANHQTAEAVERLAAPGLRAVVGLHLSAENNLPELALDVLNRSVQSAVPVHAVPRTEMLRIGLEDRLAFARRPVPAASRRSG